MLLPLYCPSAFVASAYISHNFSEKHINFLFLICKNLYRRILYALEEKKAESSRKKSMLRILCVVFIQLNLMENCTFSWRFKTRIWYLCVSLKKSSDVFFCTLSSFRGHRASPRPLKTTFILFLGWIVGGKSNFIDMITAPGKPRKNWNIGVKFVYFFIGPGIEQSDLYKKGTRSHVTPWICYCMYICT